MSDETWNKEEVLRALDKAERKAFIEGTLAMLEHFFNVLDATKKREPIEIVEIIKKEVDEHIGDANESLASMLHDRMLIDLGIWGDWCVLKQPGKQEAAQPQETKGAMD